MRLDQGEDEFYHQWNGKCSAIEIERFEEEMNFFEGITDVW